MGSMNFYKGDKKKKKKGEQGKPMSFAPAFVPPKIIPKGKEEK